MSRVLSQKMAKHAAEAFLKREGITGLPVDPFVVAETRDVIFWGKPDKAEGVSGMLLRHGSDFCIVHTPIRSAGPNRQRSKMRDKSRAKSCWGP